MLAIRSALRGAAAVAAVGAMLVCVRRSAAGSVPACRLDDSRNDIARATLEQSIAAYAAIGVSFTFTSIRVNPRAPSDAETLDIYVVRDAAADAVDAAGCTTTAGDSDAPLDATSVAGGCVVSSYAQVEIRCSAAAIRIFSDVGTREEIANPSLVYVLAHELAHVHQRRVGEFGERVERLDLQVDAVSKLARLRAGCEPALIEREEKADALAVRVLAQLASQRPYRQPVFSERGSMYWTIDQLALAADAWDSAGAEGTIRTPDELHPAFTPTEFPMPPDAVAKGARRFVCDVLTKKQGTVAFRVRPATHPPMADRLRHVAEALEPLARRLPDTGGSVDFAPVARLQQDVAPIFAMIHRENGAYVAALYDAICTLVNGPNPQAACAR